MTYLAPRQGFFAAILILSFVLHLIFFVVSLDREINDENRQIAEKAVATLTQELSSSLAAFDRVSMSVIAEPYANERAISYVGIYDAQDQALVPLGTPSGGQQVSQVITSGEQVLGRVVVEAEPVSYAQLLSTYWLFLIGAIGLHVLLWFVYGHLARPTDKLKYEIARDVRNDLLSKGFLTQQPEPAQAQEAQKVDAQTKTFTSDYISELPKDKPSNDSASADEAASDSDNAIEPNSMVQLKYHDPAGLLPTLSIDAKQAYFALCDQLLLRASEAVMQMPLFSGVKIVEVAGFNEEGVCVELYAENAQAKTAAAAAMLAKLMVVVNQIVYDKHREIRRFALSLHAICCETSMAKDAAQLIKLHDEPLMVLMGDTARQQVTHYMKLATLTHPRSVQERDARIITDISNATADRLQSALDKILTA